MDIFDILRLVQEYTDVRYLLSTAKLLGEAKRYVLHWNLNKAFSMKYYSDLNFRFETDKMVVSSRDQIRINLSCCSNITDVSALGNVHTLHLSHCESIIV